MLSLAPVSNCLALENQSDQTRAEKRCVDDGWRKISLTAAGIHRDLLWKGPDSVWRNGAIIVMHGGGGAAADFCSGGLLIRPQTHFARMAIERGFAIFLLNSTRDKVTDANGRACGKRFDFTVLDRPNLDLPYIGEVIDRIIPQRRPPMSSRAISLTGLSTGGYMTIRAATHFDDRITAFAPISAGDPYGTHTNCDPALSPRKSAKGILLDNETGKQIIDKDACRSPGDVQEKQWISRNSPHKPAFRQFQHRSDGIVDFSCMEKAGRMLRNHGYPDRGAYLLGRAGDESVWKHLWQEEYNAPLLDFLESEARAATTR